MISDDTAIRSSVEIANVAIALDTLAGQMDGWAKGSRGFLSSQSNQQIAAAFDTRRLAVVVRGIADRLKRAE